MFTNNNNNNNNNNDATNNNSVNNKVTKNVNAKELRDILKDKHQKMEHMKERLRVPSQLISVVKKSGQNTSSDIEHNNHNQQQQSNNSGNSNNVQDAAAVVGDSVLYLPDDHDPTDERSVQKEIAAWKERHLKRLEKMMS